MKASRVAALAALLAASPLLTARESYAQTMQRGDRAADSLARHLETVSRLLSRTNARLEAINRTLQPPTAESPRIEAALDSIRREGAEMERLLTELDTKVRGVADFPGGGFRTIQEALDALPNGGTLRIAPGTYPIDSPLFVRGQRVFVRGPGLRGPTARLVAPRPERVVPASEALGVFNFVDAGGGLEGFEIFGGDASVVTAGGSDTPLEIRDMRMAHTGRGVLALAPANLTVLDTAIQDVAWNGISFAPQNLTSFPTGPIGTTGSA